MTPHRSSAPLAVFDSRPWLLGIALLLSACAPSAATSAVVPAPTSDVAQLPRAANLLAGVVRQVTGDQITVQSQNGTVNAALTPNAVLLRQAMVPLSELGVGDMVTFAGERDGTGAIVARVVRAAPSGLGQEGLALLSDQSRPLAGNDAATERPRPGPGAQVPPQGQRGRSPADLTITGSIDAVNGEALVVTSATVIYTVRLAADGQVNRITLAAAGDLRPGARIIARGEQRDEVWTVSALLLVGDGRGADRSF